MGAMFALCILKISFSMLGFSLVSFMMNRTNQVVTYILWQVKTENAKFLFNTFFIFFWGKALASTQEMVAGRGYNWWPALSLTPWPYLLPFSLH